MGGIDESILPPLRFASSGLMRLVKRYGVVPNEKLHELTTEERNTKLLVALGSLEPDLLRRVSADLNVPIVANSDLISESVRSFLQSLQGIDRHFALRHRILPLRCKDEAFEVAFADPLDVETLTELEFRFQRKVRVALGSEGGIVRAIHRFFPARGESDPHGAANKVLSPSDVEVGEVESGADAEPIVRLVNQILLDAITAEASDIHLEPSASALQVRYRIDGVMTSRAPVARDIQPYVVTRLKLLAGMNIAERRRPQDGRFRVRVNDRSSRDLRASTVPTPFGEKIVLRILAGGVERVSFDLLGMSGPLQAELKKALSATDQLIAVTGPTGSGKSTTLYAALRYLMNGEMTIVTVEDPIECRLEGLTQIQVDSQIGVTFASGLRSILRQDPDVIMVGEVRDLETAQTAFQAAQTGHLVLTTLHTNDAPSTIVRLLDLGIEPFLLASSLRAVLAQRLVRKICSACRRPLDLQRAEELTRRYGLAPDKLSIGSGCDECSGAGFHGRIGVFSLLSLTEELRTLVRNRASEAEIAKRAYDFGMRQLGEAALELLQNGETTLDEIERSIGGDLRGATLRAAPAKVVRHGAVENTAVDGISSGMSLAELARGESPPAEPLPSILLIDDDPGVRRVLSRILKRADFQVIEAADGLEGLRTLELNPLPSLIVCDLIMPGLSGEALLQELRSRERFRSVPILMLTGSDDERHEIALLEAGADDFVSKTCSPELLLARIRSVLRGSGEVEP